jgi:membrane protease YdiL (CAAX protease family)
MNSSALEKQKTIRNLVIFTTCIIVIPWLGCWLDVQSGNPTHNQDQSLGWLLFLITPLATVLLLRLFGGDGWKDFGLNPSFKGNGKEYLFALLFHPGSMILLLLLGFAFGLTSIPQLSGTKLAIAGQAILVALIPNFIKNIFEEFAWRGYLTPKMHSAVKNQLAGHLLVGVIWFSWHLPYYLVLLPRTVLQSATSLDMGWFLALGFVGILPTSILYGELRLRTSSVWPAVLIHMSANLFFDTLASQKFFQFPNTLAEIIFAPGLFGILVILLNAVVGLWLYRNRLQNMTRNVHA